MTILPQKNSSIIFKIALTLLIVASSLLVSTTAADAISVSTSPNPAWPSKCGLKIGLLIDRSNSVGDAGSTVVTQYRTAAKGFVDALAGTASEIAVASFSESSTQNLPLTSISNSSGATTVKNTIDAITFPSGVNSGSTNWEEAFYSQQTVAADVIIILTDGNPTKRGINGSYSGTGYDDSADYDIDAGITRSNQLKAVGQNKRVVAVGIGSGVNTTNLKAVSGPTVNSDYFTSADFASLNAKLTELATKICGGTVTVQKQVKNTNGSYTNTNGWDYTATNAVANNKTTATTGSTDGIAEFKYENAPKTTTITETLKSGYVLESISCTKNGQAIGSVQGLGVTLTINASDIISCIFKNKPTTGKVIVTKQVKNLDGSYTNTNGWDYVATNAVVGSKTTAGSGTAQFDYEVTPKTSKITETVKSGFSIESVTCLNGNTTVATSLNASVDVTVPTDGTINCYFKNTQDTGTLKVVKKTIGGEGTFGFTSNSPLGNFDLSTVLGTAETTATTSVPGTYSITESALSGWSLTGLTCTGTTPTVAGSKVTVTLVKNTNVVCTFTNTRDQGTIQVVKKTNGGNGTFAFTSNSALGNFNLTTANGTAQTSATAVDTGTYNLAETVPAGWTLTGLACTGGTTTLTKPSVSITVAKGQSIVCTYTNTRDTATLTVKKIATGGDAKFSFTSNTALNNFDLTTSGGNATTVATSIPTGTYDITESVLAGWTLDNLVCVGTNAPVYSGNKVTINAATSQNIVCTYTNSRDTGKITVVKNAVGGNGTFGFTSTTPLGNFPMTTQNGTVSTATVSAPTGNYDISEIVPAGWSLSSKVCADTLLNPNGPIVGSTATGVTIAITKGSNITCTFTNTRDTGTLKVVKNTIGGNDTFAFTSSSVLGAFNLTTASNTASTLATTVDTATYTITETAKSGWTLTGATCDAGAPTLNGNVLSVTVAKGAAITCTFTNSRDTGTIKVVKNTVGGNGTFAFVSTTPLNDFGLTTQNGTATTDPKAIDSGSYTVSETVPAGWTLTSATCTNAQTSLQGSTLTISVVKGANVVCTFTNTRDTGSLKVVKNTVGGNDTFAFTSSSVLGAFNLTTTSNTASTLATTVDTATYTISETAKTGWTLTGATCDAGSPTLSGSTISVTVAKGANITCTFTNTRDQGTIKVVKNVVAAGGVKDGTFGFTSNTTLGNFNLTTVDGTKSTDVKAIDTNNYTISETVLEGWTLTGATCDTDSYSFNGSTISVTVSKGANITCTFTNTRDTAKITVVKNVVEAGGVKDGAFDFNSNINAFGTDGKFKLSTKDGTAKTETVQIPTGFYNVSETIPDGWTLTSQACTGTNANQDGGLYLTLKKDETAVCTFTNTRDTLTLQVVENAVGGNDTFPFTLAGPSGPSTFDLTTVGGTKSTAVNVIPTGAYDLAQLVPTGWTLTDLKCSGATDPTVVNPKVSFTGTQGQTIVCTFTDTKVPEVLGTVVTRPADTIVPPQVKGISASSLPRTGAATQSLLAIVATLILTGLIFFASTRRRKAL